MTALWIVLGVAAALEAVDAAVLEALLKAQREALRFQLTAVR